MEQDLKLATSETEAQQIIDRYIAETSRINANANMMDAQTNATQAVDNMNTGFSDTNSSR